MTKLCDNTNEKAKILIADDSEMNRELLSAMLGDSYDYVYAEDGEQLMHLLFESVEADILLLDMHMPNMNGMEVLKIMREHNWLEELPVIVISAEDDKGFVQNAYSLGAEDYIPRPFDAFMVEHRVKNVLKMYKRNKQLVKLVEKQVMKRERVNNTLINILSHVLEVCNHESGSHSLRIQQITNMLLLHLIELTDRYNLTKEDISLICSVSALHDIGKTMIPDAILNKPDTLSDEEWVIMKSHTEQGDKLLWELAVNQNEKLMIFAHEVCRHHHERYDGTGYPDGLKEDEIPISAQVVSVADVYDALTSERCYKSAFSHEKAIEMILSGECGSFNPLLMRCLSDISDEMIEELSLNLNLGDVELRSMDIIHELTDEELEDDELTIADRAAEISEYERAKREFFEELCGGIQFEYDAVAHKVIYFSRFDGTGQRQLLSESNVSLMGFDDRKLLYEKLRQTTSKQPAVTMMTQVPIDGLNRWHEVTARTIWEEDSESYVGIVGQLTDVHDDILRSNIELNIRGEILTAESFLAMRNLFDVVRVVDPTDCTIIEIDADGKTHKGRTKCYELWNRNEACLNCTSSKALENKSWMTKLEVKDGKIFSVLSRYAECDGKPCVIEVALCMEQGESKQSDIGISFMPDTNILQKYYRDTLTEAYSRAYLDNFRAGFENVAGVAIADIDRFKQINDTYGHIAGDDALRHISAVIGSCLRDGDILIRYGGDEFLILFPKIEEDEFYNIIAQIKSRVSESVPEQYSEAALSVSIGGVYHAESLNKAIAEADKAMYRDKFRERQ